MPRMQKYRGHYLIGIDGDDLNFLPSKDLLENNYRGFSTVNNQETHYLKMYLTKAVDLLSGTVLNFDYSSTQDEIGMACGMISSLPAGSIAIYDRLYLSSILIETHASCGSLFLARCKTGATFKEIMGFCKDKKKRSHFEYQTNTGEIVTINLIKIKNPKKKGEYIILATNIDTTDWDSDEIANVYTLRWDCETANRDSTSSLKMDQWHSSFLNGILQEIYTHFIMFNTSKITIFENGGYEINLKNNITKKSNFKLIFSMMVSLLPKVLKGKVRTISTDIKIWIKRTIEKRKRLKRHYDRVIKKKGRLFPLKSLVKRRAR
jgi:hypothetical protein